MPSASRARTRQDAAATLRSRESKYNAQCSELFAMHVASACTPPSDGSSALQQALAACANDPYGDGDQTPVPDEATRRRIKSKARNVCEAMMMREGACEPLQSAWTGCMDGVQGVLSGREESEFHLMCFLGAVEAVRGSIEDARMKQNGGEKDAMLHLLEARVSDIRLAPLHYCAMGAKSVRGVEGGVGLNRFCEVAEELCKAGARVDSRDIAGCTPLGVAVGMAATERSAELVDVFVRYGADVNAELRFGTAIIAGSIASNNVTVFRKLLEAGAELTDENPFYRAVWDSPSLMNALMEVQRERWLKLELCGGCGKGGAGKFCAKCRIVFYCSKECQVKDWKVHKKVCCGVGEMVKLDVGRMAFDDVRRVQSFLVNPITGVRPNRKMRMRSDERFVVKLSWIMAKEELMGVGIEPFVGCVKVEDRIGQFLLLQKTGHMAGMHAKLRKYISEQSGGVGMVYVAAQWASKGILQFDLSRPLPPPKTWW